MKRKYLKSFGISWDWGDLASPDTGAILKERHADFREIDNFIKNSTFAFESYIEERLKSEKYVFGDPPHESLAIILTARPHAKVQVRPHLYAYVHYDPQAVLEHERSREKLGELFIAWVEQASQSLRGVDDFPVNQFQKICSDYRAQGYTTHFAVSSMAIPDTRLRLCIEVEMDAVETRRYATVRHRGKEIGRKLTTYSGPGSWLYMLRSSEHLEREGDMLIYYPESPSLVARQFQDGAELPRIEQPEAQPVQIDLGEFPLVVDHMTRNSKQA